MKDDRYEICFSGSGGQGIITAAIVLAEAVCVYEGKFVSQTQNYGPEARGGTSRAGVVISSESIDYPKIIKPDLLLAMNQASCDAYFGILKSEGLLVVDSGLVNQIPTNRYIKIPFTQIARKQLGNELAANMVALGAVAYISGVVSMNHLEKALKTKVPKGTEEINIKGLRAGIKAAKAIDINTLPVYISADDDEI